MISHWPRLLVFPLLGALLGYLTNWIAIMLLFRPQRRVLGIQGLLEKRKVDIARNTAEIVRTHLLNTAEIRRLVDRDKARRSIDRLIDRQLSLMPRLARRLLSRGVRELTYRYVFDKDGYVKEELLELALSDADLERIMVEKICATDLSQLERIIRTASGPEIRFILFTGAVLGFVVGLVEAVLPL
ncbi:MAG: DUF445 family protein [Acidobacteriota bacterium]|jgi:uncharacterized membrane protein YheB (UPF0754 family)|nr:DUF445 family protein [Acidobacteriota bacterium]